MWDMRAATARTSGVAAMVGDLLKIWFSAGALARDGEAVRYVRTALTRWSGEGYALACEALGAAVLRAPPPEQPLRDRAATAPAGEGDRRLAGVRGHIPNHARAPEPAFRRVLEDIQELNVAA